MDSVPATQTSVYLYYDASDILIYVGITSRGARRQAEHNEGKDWWQYVTRQAVEHYPTRGKAQARETELIRSHNPPFNKQQNPAYAIVNLAYLKFRESQQGDVNLREALRAMQQRIDLDVHHQAEGEPIVLRSRLDDSVLTSTMRLPEPGPARVLGLGKNSYHVKRVTNAGPLALIELSPMTGHPIEMAYAQVKFDQKQRLVLRNVHVVLDHSDPELCNKRCAKTPNAKRRYNEIRWVRPDGEGRG